MTTNDPTWWVPDRELTPEEEALSGSFADERTDDQSKKD